MAFLYAFINGFHDGGNVLATIVASRSMKPRKALLYACAAEFTGPLLLGTGVAVTMGTGIIQWDFVHAGMPDIALLFLLSAMAAAIIWNLVTWYFKLPSSSSHALVGGLLGAGVTAYGPDSLNWNTLLFKVLLVLLLSPLIGGVFGNLILKGLTKLMYYCNPRINKYIKKIQIFSMILLGLSHSSNDSQKPMGLIIIALLVSGNISAFKVPFWVQLGCAIAITAGLYLSGWRIVGTVGRKIFKVKPIHSLSAQFAAALTIIASSLIGRNGQLDPGDQLGHCRHRPGGKKKCGELGYGEKHRGFMDHHHSSLGRDRFRALFFSINKYQLVSISINKYQYRALKNVCQDWIYSIKTWQVWNSG